MSIQKVWLIEQLRYGPRLRLDTVMQIQNSPAQFKSHGLMQFLDQLKPTSS